MLQLNDIQINIYATVTTIIIVTVSMTTTLLYYWLLMADYWSSNPCDRASYLMLVIPSGLVRILPIDGCLVIVKNSINNCLLIVNNLLILINYLLLFLMVVDG